MIEKPPKYQEKVEVEANYFDIQIKLQQLRQPPYVAPEGQNLGFFLSKCIILKRCLHLKGVFAKNERGYRLNAIKKTLLIATNLTSICCVFKEKLVKVVSYRRT